MRRGVAHRPETPRSATRRLTDVRVRACLRAVRIGVVTHTLVAKKLKHDQHTKREAAMPKNAHLQKAAEYDDLDD